jgi:hypothetical protein
MSDHGLALEPLETPVHPLTADIDGLAGDSPIAGWIVGGVIGVGAAVIIAAIIIVP